MSTELTRRSVLVASALAGLPRFALGAESAPDFLDQDTRDILVEEGEPLAGGLKARAVITAFWNDLPTSARPALSWPADDAAYDYRHLTAEPNADQAFDLTPAVLESYFGLCGYNDAQAGEVVLFGLRGAGLADGSDWSGFAERQHVKEDRPDHIHTRCLIGVLDRRRKAIALASASTVPVVELMMAAAAGKLGCNMLPTGLHAYKVGPHKGLRQPGAFRQQKSLWVHRAKGDLVYALSDRNNVWDDGDGVLPMDDIHAAVLSYRSRPPYFSSAGCQVVKGAYDKTTHQPIGPWASFRDAAGLSPKVHPLDKRGRTADDGRKFIYVLLTGKEARLMGAGRTQFVATRRFGAADLVVARLQSALGIQPATGAFDRKTMGKIISWQIKRGEPPTGILTSSDISAITGKGA